jgi:hypothetical protein
MPVMASLATSRNVGLLPAFIPSREKASHLKKSSFVDSSTASRFSTAALPAKPTLVLPAAPSRSERTPRPESVPRASDSLKFDRT